MLGSWRFTTAPNGLNRRRKLWIVSFKNSKGVSDQTAKAKVRARPKSVLTSLYNKRAMSTIDARISPLKVSKSIRRSKIPRAKSAYGPRSGTTIDSMTLSNGSYGRTMTDTTSRLGLSQSSGSLPLQKTVGFDMTKTAGSSSHGSGRSEHSGTKVGILRNKSRARPRMANDQRSDRNRKCSSVMQVLNWETPFAL